MAPILARKKLGTCSWDEFWGKGYATEALKAYLDHYWSLPRREYFRTVIEGNGDVVTTTDSEEEEEEEVLRRSPRRAT